MNRRNFLTLMGSGLISLSANGFGRIIKSGTRDYSLVILGDTHFDTEPASVYHANYNEQVEWLNNVQRKEFARNGEMWRERCPRLLKRAAQLIDSNTKMVLQMGDLIQGDCGKGEVHRQMLDDVMNRFKGELGGLPFVTVVGNHDIRGVDAEATYKSYMPARMSEELQKPITKTTFCFRIGEDAFIVIDFNKPDDEEIKKCLEETKGARHTFVIVHGPVFPPDEDNCRWIFHGGASDKETEARHYFRREFAQRHAIVLCGHTHTTEFMDWWGDGGRITQMTMSSVWTKEEQKEFVIRTQGASQYGTRRQEMLQKPENANKKDETPFFDEYREGIREYVNTRAQGSYKLNVGRKHVTVDFYGGDSKEVTHRFVIR